MSGNKSSFIRGKNLKSSFPLRNFKFLIRFITSNVWQLIWLRMVKCIWRNHQKIKRQTWLLAQDVICLFDSYLKGKIHLTIKLIGQYKFKWIGKVDKADGGKSQPFSTTKPQNQGYVVCICWDQLLLSRSSMIFNGSAVIATLKIPFSCFFSLQFLLRYSLW